MEHPDITRMREAGELKSPKICDTCDECGEPIQEGEEFYSFDPPYAVCENCCWDYLYKLAKKCKKVAELGADFR